MSIDFSPVRDFAESLARGSGPQEWLWQLGVAATALVLGWWTAHVVCREVRPSPKWKFGAGDFERVAYPLCAYFFMLAGRLILERFQAAPLLDIVQTLLVAWIVIRVAVYVLGHVLPEGGFLRASIRIIAWVAWLGVALHITGLLPEVVEAVDSVGFNFGKNRQRISLWLILQAVTALALTLAVAAWISRITETRVMAAKHVEMSTKVVIAKVVRVATLFIAVLVALPLVGIDITALSIFSGALGVGLGFGLQKIASNYVSGFIVLLDRSLRIGDLITVDNRRGVVQAIESRYTVIKATDGTESIIPNEKLITESVNHHTYTDPKVAVIVPVQVSYESDLDQALATLLECARAQQLVLAEPAPVSRLKSFRDDGVELELVCWIGDVVMGDADVKSDLMRAILRRFGERGIDIPYPRRDVRFLTTPETQNNPVAPST
jgi:small-conductance mechanosensitive channel